MHPAQLSPLLAVLLAASAFSQPLIRQMASDTIGCQNREEFEKIVKLAGYDKDKEASGRAMLAGLTSGRCVMLNAGDRVYVLDHKLLWRRIQVRPQGKPDGYWTASDMVR